MLYTTSVTPSPAARQLEVREGPAVDREERLGHPLRGRTHPGRQPATRMTTRQGHQSRTFTVEPSRSKLKCTSVRPSPVMAMRRACVSSA